MKKVILIILIILLVACGGFIIYYIYDSRDIEQENNNEVSNVNTNVNNDNSINNVNTTVENNEDSSENSTSNENDDGTFQVREVEKEDYNSYYKVVEIPDVAKNCVSVEKQDDNLVISLIESDTNEMLLERENDVIYNKKYTVSNVNAKDVKSIFYGVEGQDVGYPLVFLLQNDGTVKGIDIEYGYQTGNFIAKNISGIENIDKFEQVDVTPPNDSGFMGVVAITENNSVYVIQHK